MTDIVAFPGRYNHHFSLDVVAPKYLINILVSNFVLNSFNPDFHSVQFSERAESCAGSLSFEMCVVM